MERFKVQRSDNSCWATVSRVGGDGAQERTKYRSNCRRNPRSGMHTCAAHSELETLAVSLDHRLKEAEAQGDSHISILPDDLDH